ncbi:hypothetical protein Tco_0537023 [Tanacetum coccineum]
MIDLVDCETLWWIGLHVDCRTRVLLWIVLVIAAIVSIMRMLRLKAVARKTVSYAFSDSVLFTPLCCDDIHDVTPRVSALAGCDKLDVHWTRAVLL